MASGSPSAEATHHAGGAARSAGRSPHRPNQASFMRAVPDRRGLAAWSVPGDFPHYGVDPRPPWDRVATRPARPNVIFSADGGHLSSLATTRAPAALSPKSVHFFRRHPATRGKRPLWTRTTRSMSLLPGDPARRRPDHRPPAPEHDRAGSRVSCTVRRARRSRPLQPVARGAVSCLGAAGADRHRRGRTADVRPGQGWAYMNTGYLLLSWMIIRAGLTGNISLAEEYGSAASVPLGPKATPCPQDHAEAQVTASRPGGCATSPGASPTISPRRRSSTRAPWKPAPPSGRLCRPSSARSKADEARKDGLCGDLGLGLWSTTRGRTACRHVALALPGFTHTRSPPPTEARGGDVPERRALEVQGVVAAYEVQRLVACRMRSRRWLPGKIDRATAGYPS